MLHIQVLSVPKKNLVEVPPAVWEAADITTLDLTHNQITVLPTELSMCSALEVLMLSNNKVANWPGAVMGSIPSLQELYLAAYNPFREILFAQDLPPERAFVDFVLLNVVLHLVIVNILGQNTRCN